MKGIEIIGNQIKVKYHSLEFKSHELPDYDLFTNVNEVQEFCGKNAVCWLDALNWSIMNKTALTHEIYAFISHRFFVVKSGFLMEIDKFHYNPEPLLKFIDRGTIEMIAGVLG